MHVYIIFIIILSGCVEPSVASRSFVRFVLHCVINVACERK